MSISDIVAAISSADRVLLLAHVAPDADSLGSSLALGLAINQVRSDAQVTVSFGDDPFVVPRILQSLPGQHLVRDPAAIAAELPYDVAISSDVSTAVRLGANLAAFNSARTRIVIDHHQSNDGFGDINVIDPTAEANVVLTLQVIDAIGADITSDIAHALYAGLITDTGCFKYSATTSRTHAIAARLMDAGIPHALIAQQMYDDEPFSVVQLLARALSRAVLDETAIGGRGFVWTTVPADDREELGLPEDAAERIIDVLRITSQADVAAVLKQSDTGEWKLSLRSKGGVDVSRVAQLLGGGGHRFAAGATVGDDVSLAIQAVRRALATAV